MPQFQTPAEHVVSIWRHGTPTEVGDIKRFWPEMALALDRLGEQQDHMITEPGSVHVPPLAAPRPARVPRGGSVGRGGSSGTEPTRAPIIAPQNRPSI